MRGHGVRDNNHVCTFVTHDEQIIYYSRSERRWELKREQVGAVQYDRKKHLDWTDQHNFQTRYNWSTFKVVSIENVESFEIFKCIAPFHVKKQHYHNSKKWGEI